MVTEEGGMELERRTRNPPAPQTAHIGPNFFWVVARIVLNHD